MGGALHCGGEVARISVVLETALSPASEMPVNRGTLAVGTRLRNYEIISVLGQGGFGVTYRARDLTLDREVAIKEYLPTALALREGGETVLPRSTGLSQDFLDGRSRFLDEARTLARFDGIPSIVRVLDFLEANGTAYMVMALVRGVTLASMIRRKRQLEADEVSAMFLPLLDGLEQVHGAGFLHRDIKPANVLIDDRGLPVLIDFGAARAGLIGGSVAATAIFTPGFAAAEQFTSARQGPWTDIYGLSATLYNAIAGGIPPNAFERMLDDTYRPLTQLAPKGFGHGLLAAVDAGMAVRAADRPQSIAVWRSLLAGTPGRVEQATVTMPRAKAAPASPRLVEVPPAAVRQSAAKPRLWLYAAVSAVLVALGIGGYIALMPKASPQPPAARETRPAEIMIAERREPALPTPSPPVQTTPQQSLIVVPPVPPPDRAAEQARIQAEAERQKAEQEATARAARQKAEEETRQSAAAMDKKAAEAAEAMLRLTPSDRQKAQVALTSLGFNTGGTDGAFGPRSREMIATWQKSINQPATGFLTATQQQDLLRQAAPAVARFEEEQRKAEEARRKAEEERVKAAAPASRDGLWFGSIDCKVAGRISLQGSLSGGSGTLSGAGASFTLAITGDTATLGVRSFPGGGGGRLQGRATGRNVVAQGIIIAKAGASDQCTATLVGP